jgi:hypothetical protein
MIYHLIAYVILLAASVTGLVLKDVRLYGIVLAVSLCMLVLRLAHVI